MTDKRFDFKPPTIAQLEEMRSRLNDLRVDDDAAPSPGSEAAQLIEEMTQGMQAIATQENAMSWDEDYRFEVQIDGRGVDLIIVNPSKHGTYTKGNWDAIHSQRYLLQAIARQELSKRVGLRLIEDGGEIEEEAVNKLAIAANEVWAEINRGY